MKKDKNKDFTKLTHKKGISLIVLIVTIIVIIILAAVVIFTISKNNPIENAKESTFKEDVRSFEVELALAVSKEYTSKAGQRDNKFNETELTKIQDYIPSFSEKYSEKFIIQDDELRYTDEVDEKEKEWLKELNIKEMESLLPEGYTELKYIEGTGTQYIDTGYMINYLNKIEFKIQDPIFPDSGANSFFGAGDSATKNIIALYINFNQSLGYRISQDGYNDTPIGDINELNGISTITINNGNAIINKENIEYSYDNKQCYTTRNCYIFYRNQPNFNGQPAKVKLHYFKIYENNILVRDYIPVLDKNNVPCLYDKVEGKNYYNQGTDKFIAGPKK